MSKIGKVGIFTRPIDQKTSGSGSHLNQLVDHILDINDTFDIFLIHYEKSDMDVYKRTTEILIPRNPILASRELRRYDFDILHYSPLTIFSPVWLRNARKVATIHGVAPLFLPDKYKKIEVLHERHIVPYWAHKMDYIFTVSQTSKNFIMEHWRIKENIIRITYNAVDESFRVLDREDSARAVEETYGIERPFILHISKFSERKNPWLLLRSFKLVHESDRHKKLVLVGSGWKNKKVLSFLKENQLESGVILTGFIPRQDVIKFLNTAEVFVFPSLYEGFGMPILEAMACGCPVITSKAFAIPEIAGDAALLLNDNTDPRELASKIMQLMRSPHLRDELIKRGLQRVKLFSWEESAQTVLDTYEQCLRNE